MAVEGKSAEVSGYGSRVGEEFRIWDYGSVEECEIESNGEDIMVDVMGSEVFFDGIVDGEEYIDEEEFRDFERRIDETLEIKEEEGCEYYGCDVSGSLVGTKSNEIVSCGRAVVQSVPLPGQIRQKELMVVNHQPIESDKPMVGSEYDGISYSHLYLKRKRETQDVKPKCVSRCKRSKDIVASSMQSSVYKQFEDLLTGSTKYSPADKMLSQLQMLARNPSEDHSFLSSLVGFFCDFRNKNYKKVIDEEDKNELSSPDSMESSLLYPAEDIKDSYWTNMVIQTGLSEISPAVDSLRDIHVLNSSSLKLNVEGPLMSAENKSSGDSQVPVAATMGYKNSPVELVMTFVTAQDIPSEHMLNNIFRRFGTLRETETVIYQDSSCARVVFKESSDAEVAYNSAKIFDILGRPVVNYELGYTPLLSYNSKPTKELANTIDMMSEMRIPEPEVTYEFEFSPGDISIQQDQFQNLEEIMTC